MSCKKTPSFFEDTLAQQSTVGFAPWPTICCRTQEAVRHGEAQYAAAVSRRLHKSLATEAWHGVCLLQQGRAPRAAAGYTVMTS
ncbi:hypothetical protein WJX81_002906 [Elliptochloris bilobata]|uniref:Uncharacterized protein n=1 Tax=Elliptochloris bilobata TaxID=381761 RepID=A0AAW1RXL2_9CHLO